MGDDAAPVYDARYVADFERRYRRKTEKRELKTSCSVWIKGCCSKQALKRSILGNFPFLKIMHRYKILQYFPNDVIAGMTVGIMHIPQGMAYGVMASLPPICGLYTSLFGPLIYFFFGSSRHASMGTIVVVSLMIAAVLDSRLATDDVASPLTLNITLNGTLTDLDIERTVNARKIQIATALSFLSGLIMMFLGKLGLGFVTSYMSEYLINGFVTGVAIHAVSSQMKNILGIKVKRFNGAFKVIKTWIEVFRNIADINWATFGTSVVSMVTIYAIKTQINERFKHRLRMPVPIELIVVILGTIVSHFGRFGLNFGVKVVGEIPAGLPPPRIPEVSLVTSHIGDAVMIGIIAFAQSVSLAKSIAIKNKHPLDTNQEMFAYGTGSVLCSIFSGYIPAASITRSVIQDGTGGVTQATFRYMFLYRCQAVMKQEYSVVASLASCCVVLVVVLAVGPLFYNLPTCVLSSVVFVNLRGMFMQTLQLPGLWRKSKWDFSIWTLTLICVIFLDADVGLGIGVIFSILTVVCRTQRSGFVSKGNVEMTDIYRSKQRYDHVRVLPHVKILTFEAPVYFANSDLFTMKNSAEEDNETNTKDIDVENDTPPTECDVWMEKPVDGDIHYVILDLANVLFMDTMGVGALERVVSEMESVGVSVFIVGVTEKVTGILQRTAFVDKHRSRLYINLSDVLVTIQAEM